MNDTSEAKTAHLFNDAAEALANDDTSRAKALLREVIAACPTDVEAIRQLAWVLRDTDEDPIAAEFMLTNALEDNPASVELMLELADVRLTLGDPHGASGPIKQALTLKPNNAETLYLLGNAFLDLKHHEEAARAFRSSLDSDPFSSITWYNLALACHGMGDAPGEQEALAAYLRVEPNASDRQQVEATLSKLTSVSPQV